MFSTKVMSEITGRPSFVTLNVFPLAERTVVVFSFPRVDRTSVVRAFGYIFNATGHYLEYEVSKLILRRCENFVLAPDVYDSFTDRQVEKITEYFERNICGQAYELEAPELFLFGPA